MKVWSLNPLEGFSCKSFLHILMDPSPIGESVFLILWRIKVSRKVRFFTWQVLRGRGNMKDRLSRKLPSLVGSFYCIFCRKVEEDIDHILWQCEFATSVWERFIQTFGLLFVH